MLCSHKQFLFFVVNSRYVISVYFYIIIILPAVFYSRWVHWNVPARHFSRFRNILYCNIDSSLSDFYNILPDSSDTSDCTYNYLRISMLRRKRKKPKNICPSSKLYHSSYFELLRWTYIIIFPKRKEGEKFERI